MAVNIQLRHFLILSITFCWGGIFLFYTSQSQRVLGFSSSDVQDAPLENISDWHASKNAYAFLIAGCDPSNNRAYQGYIYNILAATYILSKTGSQLDVVVMIRMSANTKLDTLSDREERWLRSAGAVIKYLPRVNDARSDSFHTAMMDKFQVLDLIEYERILFLDSDAIPLCNLDYLFDIMPSGNENTTLMRDNLIIAWKSEPASGGFFILKTGPGQLGELNEIIQEQAERDKSKRPPFDEIEGWGHNLSSSHAWKNVVGRGDNKWSFYGAYTDQGLLYYWTKYAKKDVSIVINGVVEHWSVKSHSDVELIGTSPTSDLIDRHSCSRRFFHQQSGVIYTHSPYRDFYHFSGGNKPWLHKFRYSIPPDKVQSMEHITDTVEMWYHALRRQVELLSLRDEIDVDRLNFNSSWPPLGMWPSHTQVKENRAATADILNVGGNKTLST